MTDPDAVLDALYGGAPADPAQLRGALADAVARKVADSQQAGRRFFEEQTAALIAAAEALAASFAAGGRLYTMGNGGSACDAAHIAVEFAHPVTAGRRALPTVNLCADQAMLTAVANDVGVNELFCRPLVAQARAQDALIGVSTSGNSPNLLTAFDAAAAIGMTTVALSGAGGGALAESASVQHCLTVPTGSVHRVQETHVLIYHLLWDLVHGFLAGQS